MFGLVGFRSLAQLWRQVREIWVPSQSPHPPAFRGMKWHFLSAGPIISVLCIGLHFYADDLLLVYFTFYYLLISLHFKASFP